MRVRFRRPSSEQVYVAGFLLQPLPAHLMANIAPDSMSTSAFARAPVGNGPYRFVRREPGQSVELRAVDNFFLGRPGIARVIFRVVPTVDAQVNLLLAGGDIGQAGWDSRHMPAVRQQWIAQGGTREQFDEIVRAVDPVTYAASLKGRRILMLNAEDDEVIPRACTDSLWKALGEPEIRWYAGGHFSVLRHLFSALMTVGHFFQRE